MVLRYLRERKKLVLCVVCVYLALCYLAYRRLRSGGIRIATDTLSIWNRDLQLLSRSVIGVDGPLGPTAKAVVTVAIGSGITSRKLRDVSARNVAAKFQFFHVFLPSFCRTASAHFDYRFYLGYDRSDQVLSRQRIRDAFQGEFKAATTSGQCRDREITVSSLTLLECDYAGKPAWAQNDAMLEAYLDHVDYLYRINDDTRLLTAGWTEKFISKLEKYVPPRVGVVGPNHSGGNTGILTYDFVHRTHVDILGFYYPHVFTDWWGDTWITRVYKPNRSTKLGDVRLAHTLGMGQRYQVHYQVKRHLEEQLKRDIGVVDRFVKAVNDNVASGVRRDRRKVISMSLYGKDPRYTWGALRNAQLLPVYLPDWTLRIYVAADPAPAELAVPRRILNKLRLLGAEVAHVAAATGNSMAAARNWRLLVAADENVDYFVVRDADGRLSEREAVAVRDWLLATERDPHSALVHCIRDHPKHAEQPIVDGLWGGQPQKLRRLLNHNITTLLNSASASNTSRDKTDSMRTFLNDRLWPAVSNASYCHDSVSPCERRTQSRSEFALPPRHGLEYIGQKFDEHQQLLSADADLLLKTDAVCSLSTSTSKPSSGYPHWNRTQHHANVSSPAVSGHS